jgi:hypothetical protein
MSFVFGSDWLLDETATTRVAWAPISLALRFLDSPFSFIAFDAEDERRRVD